MSEDDHCWDNVTYQKFIVIVKKKISNELLVIEEQSHNLISTLFDNNYTHKIMIGLRL